MSLRVCPEDGCPELTNGGRCADCKREYERARGSRQQRGYGAEHTTLRKQWAPQVAAGTVICWRCEQPIQPGTAWDLGHDDNDRTKYRGPEHANECNRRAAGQAAHK